MVNELIYKFSFVIVNILNRASILRDVKSSTKKAPASKSLVLLGDNEIGRTTLIAKLQGTDDPKRGAGLEYHYIDVRDDDRDGILFSFF